jgi:hypothetical protein
MLPRISIAGFDGNLYPGTAAVRFLSTRTGVSSTNILR